MLILPEPDKEGNICSMPLAKALGDRRSCRTFAESPMTLESLSQVLWAANGNTKHGNRTTPSAGALYPINIYVITFNIEGIAENDGWLYDGGAHRLLPLRLKEDVGCPCFGVLEATHDNQAISTSAMTIVLAADMRRTTKKYTQRGERYVLLEAGHIAQNILLQATALGLGAVTIGAGNSNKIAKSMRFAKGEEHLYLIPVGTLT